MSATDISGPLNITGSKDTAGNLTGGGFNLQKGFLQENVSSSLTAHAGGGQANALLLANEINVVGTVATVGDSVALPLAAAGYSIIVINSGANPMQVYGSGTDTINGVATATGVSQPPNSIVEYVSTSAAPGGAWIAEGIGIGYAGQYPTESYQDNITAHAGGGQGSATALTTAINRITTVASIGDSVLLPTSAPGMDIIVINHGANSMQVFGSGTDQIDDVASGTGVAQMAGSVCLYFCVTAGRWYSNGIGTGYSGQLPTLSYTDGITAHAGGGRPSAVALTTAMNRVTTVATAGDSVVLPAAAPGQQIIVINAAATNAMQVFAQGSDTIDGTAGSTGYSQVAGKTVTYFSTAAGAWHKQVSA